MPGMIYKFNPENSDFFVGNFLTVNKKSRFPTGGGFKILIPFCDSCKAFSCFIIDFQVNLYLFFLDIDILLNQIVYVDIMLYNCF